MIDPGKLNRLATFQVKTETAADFGQVTDTWTTARQAWAMVTDRSQSRIDAAGRRQTEITAVMTTQYFPYQTFGPATHRVILEGGTWELIGPGEPIDKALTNTGLTWRIRRIA